MPNARIVKLFYYSSARDHDATGNVQCSRQGLVAVERTITDTETRTPIQSTIELLLMGELTAEERVAGLGTEYPLPGVALTGATLKDGVLTLALSDPENKTSGGACRAGILWLQIEATALQFPEVREVRFAPEFLFQP
jgi:hypothetical protein